MTGSLLVLAPLRLEARAVASGATGSVATTVVRTGMGPQRAAATARRLHPAGGPPRARLAVVVAGVAGALADDLDPGDLVVADQVVGPSGQVVVRLPTAGSLAAELRRAGLPARVGAVTSTARIVSGRRRRALLGAASGAVAVDMESAALLAHPWDAPTALIRAIADRPGQDLWSPATLANGLRACRALRAAAPVLEHWAAALPTSPPSPMEVC